MHDFMIRSSAAAVVLALLGGCANLAPDYRQPDAPVPATLGNADGYAGKAIDSKGLQDNTLEDQRWRQVFADPALQAVIAQALANNRDWRMAMLNVEKARAQYQIVDSARYPSVNAGVSGNHQRTPASVNGSGTPQISHQYSATVGVTSFELDVFGRVQNLSEAAFRDYMATTEARQSARLSLIANVANGWYALAAAQQKLAVARATLASRQETQQLIERRLAAGVAGELELREAQTQTETAAVDVARYLSQVQQSRNALQLLAGAPVDVTSLPDGWQGAAVPGVPAIPADLPSSALLQRPDVKQAEQQLRAADANIGAARAAFFPSITLTANAGAASTQLNQLFKGGSGTWLFAPQINLPIFDGGRNQASLDAAKVGRELAVAGYEKAIQSGFREVADGLAQLQGDADQLAAQSRVLAASQQALKLADARYQKGVSGYLDVLLAQRSYYGAQLVQIGLQQEQAANQISLYKALALY